MKRASGLVQAGRGGIKMETGFIDRHLQNFVNIAAPVSNLQQLRLEPASLAHRTGDEDIGEKLHFDLFSAGAVAAGAAARAAVERKIAAGESLRAGAIGVGEKIANKIIRAEVERGVGPG